MKKQYWENIKKIGGSNLHFCVNIDIFTFFIKDYWNYFQPITEMDIIMRGLYAHFVGANFLLKKKSACFVSRNVADNHIKIWGGKEKPNSSDEFGWSPDISLDCQDIISEINSMMKKKVLW